MKKDNVVSLKKPFYNSETLTLLRDGARTLCSGSPLQHTGEAGAADALLALIRG